MALNEYEFKGEFQYLKHASDRIYERMRDVLTDRPLFPDATTSLTDFGEDALHGYVYCMRVADTKGLDPTKFIPITAEVVAPTYSLEKRLGPTIMEQLRGIDFSLLGSPPSLRLERIRPRSIIVFGHAAVTLGYLKKRGKVALSDLVPVSPREPLSDGNMALRSDWDVPLDKEGVWYTLSKLNETVRVAAWEPHVLNSREGCEKAYWAACFFAASNHLLSEPHMEPSFRESQNPAS